MVTREQILLRLLTLPGKLSAFEPFRDVDHCFHCFTVSKCTLMCGRRGVEGRGERRKRREGRKGKRGIKPGRC